MRQSNAAARRGIQGRQLLAGRIRQGGSRYGEGREVSEDVYEIHKSQRIRDCASVKACGPWKGFPCDAIALYQYRDKRYCGAHLFEGITTADAERKA